MRIDRIAACLLGLVLALGGMPAQAQFTKSTMNSQVASQFPDNATGAITPATTRTFLNNIIASYQQAPVVNAQVGASYTFAATDYGSLVTFNNGGAVAVTLPQATGAFNPFSVMVANLGAGLVTITPATSTINGGATLAVKQNGFVLIVSDGTNYQIFGVPGALAAALFPALTGDVTTAAGSVSTTIAANAVTNAKAAQCAANCIKGNNTGGASNVLDLTPGQAGAVLCTPNTQIFTSGTSQTYTTPTCNSVTATWIEVHVQGGGGGGGGSSNGGAPTNGTAGNASSFGVLTANGGALGLAGANTPVTGGAGGTCSGSLGTQQNFPGSAANGVPNQTAQNSIPNGAASYYGGYGAAAYASGGGGAIGGAAPANSGGGGAGGTSGTTASVTNGAGGGAGCHIWSIITTPAATITYTVGASAAGGNAGTSGFAGGAGAAGLITVVAHWQ